MPHIKEIVTLENVSTQRKVLEIHTCNFWLVFKAPWNSYNTINDDENIKIFTQVFL